VKNGLRAIPSAFSTVAGAAQIHEHCERARLHEVDFMRVESVRSKLCSGGTTFVSPGYPQHPITWWGIFNEYNINGLTASQYIQVYDAVVPAFLGVDSTIKFSALELAVADPAVRGASHERRCQCPGECRLHAFLSHL
jgi:hypothetical protein